VYRGEERWMSSFLWLLVVSKWMYPFLIEWTGTGGTGMSGPVLVSTNTIPFVVIEFFYAPLRRSRGVGRRAQCCALGSSAPLREGLRRRCGAEGQLDTDGAKEEYAETVFCIL
jgi:hypothetical protein